jgi:hypothetical protein
MNTFIGKFRRFTVLAAAAVLVLAGVSCDSGSGGGGSVYSPWFERSGSPGELTITQAPPTSTSVGSFTVHGYAKNDYLNYLWIRVSKNDEPDYDYFIRGASDGAFAQEIWLRYGPGAYTVTFYNLSQIKLNLDGEGAFYSCYGYYSTATTFGVTNARPGAASDDWMLLPSGDIQITSEIQNLSNTICAGLGTDTEKMQAINTWIILNLHYDHDSWAEDGSRDGYRKKQDALSTLRNGMGVCEGYANLTAALARAAGIETRYVTSDSLDHAWVEVCIDGTWKMLDTTWNDPDNPALNGNTAITQKYFLKDDLYYNHATDKENIKTRSTPAAEQENTPRGGAYVRRGWGE